MEWSNLSALMHLTRNHFDSPARPQNKTFKNPCKSPFILGFISFNGIFSKVRVVSCCVVLSLVRKASLG